MQDREEFLWDELTAGNVPNFARDFVEISLTRNDALGQPRSVTYWVAPDYVAIGADIDFFRMPMTPALGQHLCELVDCTMPTRRMVDDIWAHAPVQLAPFPFNPQQHDILSPALFYQHHQQIELQRAGQPLGQIVAGIKKDVVITGLLATNPNRVAIYGWHYQNGTPIQPLSTVHVDYYADYSHGVRLVRNEVLVDGTPTTVAAVLADPVLHPLLSDEGAFTSSGYTVPNAPESFPYIDAFPATGAALSTWRPKFTPPVFEPFSIPSRGGDGWTVRVFDPAGGTDSIRLGRATTRDVAVQADLFCDYRPQLATNGFERIGVFARDNAQGAFDGTFTQQGACYALAWDSHDGRVWCMRAQGGTLTDLLPNPLYRPSTAWRRLRLEARGSQLRFLIDGELLLETNDSTHATGEFGIGHHEYFASNSNMRGARADNWFADVPGALSLVLRPHAGSLEFDVHRGVPGDIYFNPITLAPGAFPNGWFFGLDASLTELGSILSSGHPAFLGLFDGTGSARHSLVGAPPGLPVYGVSIDVLDLLPPVASSPPVAIPSTF